MSSGASSGESSPWRLTASGGRSALRKRLIAISVVMMVAMVAALIIVMDIFLHPPVNGRMSQFNGPGRVLVRTPRLQMPLGLLTLGRGLVS